MTLAVRTSNQKQGSIIESGETDKGFGGTLKGLGPMFSMIVAQSASNNMIGQDSEGWDRVFTAQVSPDSCGLIFGQHIYIAYEVCSVPGSVT